MHDGQDKRALACNAERIRRLNDRLRRQGTGGRTMLTRAIATLAQQQVAAILAAVRSFDTFTTANDPWGEHDFGQVEVLGRRYFWKIDAYDINMEFGSPDPANEHITRRVLTIMTEGDL